MRKRRTRRRKEETTEEGDVDTIRKDHGEGGADARLFALAFMCLSFPFA